MFTADEIERFRSKQVINDGDACYGWSGSIGCNGYPQAYRSRRSPLPRKVDGHRMAWELAYGPVPAGMMVLHRCNTKSCTNPAHLYLGTALQNSQDAKAAGASNKAVLTSNDVLSVVALKGEGYTHAKLAERFRVSPVSIGNILQGRTHRDITGLSPRKEARS
jgi:HNH endonuclease